MTSRPLAICDCSASRVELFVHLLQSTLVHVRVDLRGRDVGMPQKLLNLAQVGATGQQMRREAVP